MAQKTKTNVMRLLDQKKIPYQSYQYESAGALSGVEVAQALGEDVERVFKTLVTVGASGRNYVFVIPVAEELNLKKAARTVGEKSIEMIREKELLPLTGYVHGGCSPVGMKKLFRTVLDQTAEKLPTIFVSAGKVGCQVEVSPEDLKKVIPFEFADLTGEF